MAARFFVVLCASALLVQAIAGCPTCNYNSYGVNAGSLANVGALANAGTLANAAAIANAGAINNAAAINAAAYNSAAYNSAAANIAAANNAAAYNSAAAINAAANSAAAINAAELAADIAVANSIGFGSGFGYPGPIYNLPVASSSGGPFSVTVNSAYAPTGLSVVSENTIEGVLDVIGSLPVFAAVALDGNVLSTGAAGTSYSCGNGNVGISSESLAAAGFGVGGSIANDITRAEIAGAQLANAAGYGAALAGEFAAASGLAAYPYGSSGLNAALNQAELAAISGFSAYPQPALYGSAGLNSAALAQAELASINAGLGASAGLGYLNRPCIY